jgi:tyrosyl-tRNA synthetase
MKSNKNAQIIHEFLTRGVEKIFPSRAFLEACLKEGKPLTMYLGIDPTGPTLHLGHAIILRKLRVWQDMGHKVILLIGDFTGMIGDPTDKTAARKRLTRWEVLENAKCYKKQAGRLIRFEGKNPAELRYNSEWLKKLTFGEVIELAAHVTVPQMLARDMFRRRLANGKDIFLHEFLYPLMQGYDSVALGVDGEIGGNDQMFNMLVGRDLLKDLQGKEKFVMTMKLLVDPAGVKMGKTEGNMVTLQDSADEMFGKVMHWTDGMILPGFELLTDVSEKEREDMEREMRVGANPRDFKARLGKEVVTLFWGKEAAERTEKRFSQTFQEHRIPDEIPAFGIKGPMNIVEFLMKSGLVGSKREARQKIDELGVRKNNERVSGSDDTVVVGDVIQKGKRFFVRAVHANSKPPSLPRRGKGRS